MTVKTSALQVSIIGCGYTGLLLAVRYLAAGAHVRGFARRLEILEQIRSYGAEALPLDLDRMLDERGFDGEVVYYCVPPASEAGDPRLVRFLSSITGTPRRVVYLSTTGVYGDHAGARVDEETPTRPGSCRAARRLAAEHAVRAWAEAHGVSWCFLRVAGIYGPGRLPLERLRRGLPAVIPREASAGNRIHVTDLVSTCIAAGIAAAADRRIYNVADGNHASATEYLLRVAAITGLPAPPLLSRAEAMKELSESARSFLAESRRIDNDRMRRELGIHLQFEDLDAGIRACLLDTAEDAIRR